MKAKGQAVTITKRTAGTYSAGAVSITETTESGFGLQTEFGFKEIDGESVMRSDIKLLLSPTGITKPTPNDKITLATGTFAVKHVSEINPSGDPILYKCQLRSI